MHIDKYGLIISGGDGGDSCQRQYEVYLRQEILKKLGLQVPVVAGLATENSAQLALEVEPGIYVRNPDLTRWYSDPDNTSRDQLTSPICYHSYMSFHGNNDSQKAIRRLLKACLKRGMFAQNIYPNWVDPRTTPVAKKLPDLLDPGLWGIFLRSSKLLSIILYPLLMVSDLFSLLGVMISLWAPIMSDGTLNFRARNPNDVDDNNLNNVIMVAQYTLATPFSWFARKLYKKFRQSNNGNIQLGETNNILGAMMWYDKLPDGNPEIVDLARPIVARY